MKNLNLTFFCFFALALQSLSAQTFTSIDIWSGTASSNPTGMTVFNGKIYFQATGDTSTTGTELWVSDGTQAGTALLKDINPGKASSYPGGFTVVGNKMFFWATDSAYGIELWVTDGTTSGTNMVADIWQGKGSGNPSCLASYNGKLYFGANDSIHGSEFWVSDGTAGGTSMVKDINPGTAGSNVFGSELGTGTFIYTLNVINNKLYFRANDGVHGTELWTSDGTTAGTAMLADIRAGAGSGSPYGLYLYNGKILFSATDSLHGDELWITDGTTAGTSLLKDINPGLNGSDATDFSNFTLYNGKVYFSAYTDAAGYELWVSDGTTSGTSMVKDIWAGPGSSYAGFFGIFSYNGKLFLSASDTLNGSQLWVSDGTGSGTTLLKVLTSYTPYYKPFSANPRAFINYNNQLIFTAEADTIVQRELWVSDGTATGTHVLSPAVAPDNNPLGNYVYSNPFSIFNNSLFMDAGFNSIGYELWEYSTPSGITETSGDHVISAWPNPFSTSITLSGLMSSGQYSIQVLDMTGREYFKTEIDHPAQDTQVSMPDLATGVYLMRVSGLGTSQTFKLVKN